MDWTGNATFHATRPVQGPFAHYHKHPAKHFGWTSGSERRAKKYEMISNYKASDSMTATVATPHISPSAPDASVVVATIFAISPEGSTHFANS